MADVLTQETLDALAHFLQALNVVLIKAPLQIIAWYIGHALMENRSGLAADVRLTLATGTAEREAALDMVDAIGGMHAETLGADKGYDTRDFVAGLRERNIRPHVAARKADIRRRSAIDKRTTRHEGYAISQRKRKRVEEIFGWLKTVGGLRKTRH